MRPPRTCWAGLALLATGCATLSPERGHAEVGALVQERTSISTGWEQGPPAPEALQARVGELLRDGLTREEVVRLALVNNPRLQADYEALGVSQADLVEAGLLRNPSLGLSARLPHTPGLVPDVEFSLVQQVLDVFMLPARKRIARRQFDADVQRTAHEALTIMREAREAYTAVQAAEKLLRYEAQRVAVTEAAAELARRQREAGNIPELDAATQEASWQEAKGELAREELRLVERREVLDRLLGLWGENTEWTLAEPLPEPPTADPPLEHLEPRALRRRLDVAAARGEVALMDEALALARTSRFIGTVEVGVSSERESEGFRVTGPSLTLELPLFDQRQTLLARLEARRRQAERRLDERAVEVRSEVRQARARLQTSRRLVEHYAKVLLPLRRRVVEQSQLQYNAMVLSPFQLLEARREEVRTYREYVETLREYWDARSGLESAVGERLPEQSPEQSPERTGEAR